MKEVFKDMNISFKGKVLDFDEFRLFLDLNKGYTKDNMFPLSNGSEKIIKKAENFLDIPYPQLPATLYLEFKRNGNRSNYEAPYFKRRQMVFYLLLAECIEQKGRFTDKLLDLVWMILEESTWVLPAHNGHPPHSNYQCPLPYCFEDNIDYIDLFAAETGALLAWVYYLGKNIFDQITPVISDRILYELNRRVIKPFLTRDDQWWTSFKGNLVNNWNPWIVSNALTVCALCVKDPNQREAFLERASRMIDGFTKNYPDDGGCDEGPTYWTVASASYFDCLEIIYDMTGGKVNGFTNPYVKKMMEYIMHMHVTDNFYLNFADSPAKLNVDYVSVARMGRRTLSQDLENFGLANYSEDKEYTDSQKTYRSVKSLYDIPLKQNEEYKVMDSVLPHLEIMVFRSNNSLIGIKGGHNAEGHNHNDVGNFIVFTNSKPLLIDVGVGTYTRDTFGPNRYKIWTMRSEYHNLPNICGYEQKSGGKYRATNTVFDTENRTFRAELKDAYNIEVLKSYTRQVKMHDDGHIELSEDIKLEQAGDITFHFMSLYEPTLKDNTLIFENGYISFNNQLEAFIEKIALDDSRLISVWDTDSVYRVHLKTKGIKEGIYQFNIFPKK